jgi:hypothetical protein
MRGHREHYFARSQLSPKDCHDLIEAQHHRMLQSVYYRDDQPIKHMAVVKGTHV